MRFLALRMSTLHVRFRSTMARTGVCPIRHKCTPKLQKSKLSHPAHSAPNTSNPSPKTSQRVQDAGLLEQIVLNYLLFVPLGCLLPFAWPERYVGDGAARGVARVALVAAACSLCVELAQLVLRVGLFELDDVLNNALGAVMGYVLYRLAERTAKLVRGRRGSARHQPRHLRR